MLSQTLRYGLLAVLLLIVSPAQAKWLKATSDAFVVYSESSEQDLGTAVEKLENFRDLLALYSTRENLPPIETKLAVYLVRSPRELLHMSPGLPKGTAGFYTASAGAIAMAAADLKSGGLTADHILFHEYAHHYMMQYFPFAFPAWYIEGIAEYFSTVEFTKGRIGVGKPVPARTADLGYFPWLPYSEVIDISPSEISSEDRPIYYAQSWLLTHYLLSDAERQKLLGQYLTEVSQGAGSWAAFSRIFGMTSEQLERRLVPYGNSMTYTWWEGVQLPEHKVVFEAMPTSADDLLLLGVNAQRGASDEYAKKTLSRIQELALADSGDEFASKVLASAEISFGDPHKAIAILGGLKSYEADAEALYLKGYAHLKLALAAGGTDTENLNAARTEFGKSFQWEPNRYQTLYRYAQSFFMISNSPPDGVVNALLRAQQLAPQVAEISINTARVLIARKKNAEAIAILTPIANDPHGGEAAEVARKLILEANSDAPDWTKLPSQGNFFGERPDEPNSHAGD